MAYTTINKSSDYFNTKTWSGNGSTQTISGIGFQPDLVWYKSRNNTYGHRWQDSVRGVGNVVYSNATQGQDTSVVNMITAYNSDGYALGADAGSNGSGVTFGSWNWKAGTTGSGNTSGSGTYKSYTYSVNTTAGFSIVYYTGNGTAGHTIPHHLGAVPSLIILKSISASEHWQMYHHKIGATKYLELSTTAAEASNTNRWHNTTPTSSVFSLGNHTSVNTDGTTYIAYCFAEKIGYSKFGSYTGNGNSNGTFVYTGFKPAMVIYKGASGANTVDNWEVVDNKRTNANIGNPKNEVLYPNLNNAEGTDTTDRMDFLSNGFKMRTNGTDYNGDGQTYIYIAFAENPLVGSNNIVSTAV
tara:strand:+ start:714 stop:1781 length:1068 start_codon:yes stop_codon:yes gene_type:complete